MAGHLEKGDRYQCEVCKGFFFAAWSDAEAKVEAVLAFGEDELKDAARVCDGCYVKILSRRPS